MDHNLEKKKAHPRRSHPLSNTRAYPFWCVLSLYHANVVIVNTGPRPNTFNVLQSLHVIAAYSCVIQWPLRWTIFMTKAQLCNPVLAIKVTLVHFSIYFLLHLLYYISSFIYIFTNIGYQRRPAH
ncbi:unnamed protein product [Penicillium nalgiovense]|nr:unnamed protein product [Penicillium nalgiovense]CAG8143292.1 unnamed protein product [Penicillium nalgiovense]CAG8148292.1 unnamed protein product [Penicillium nalgiovense]CAG8154892.1 unnamed protein product [Penicillium nalgiovense]CAG8180786.1 unnamed protein product [Penicillium nalgiovense]